MSNLPTPELPAWQEARLTQLLDAAAGVTLTEPERTSLAWLAGFEADTVTHVAAVIRRVRGLSGDLASVLARDGDRPEGGEDELWTRTQPERRPSA
ncbi:MAG TPA: hypothetical protein VE709_12555 [Pseudonocardiaceae bacterium]|jgi:hypothetical protein|nr:hypothetical protein [Pseudonocardiaceae bacterium]